MARRRFVVLTTTGYTGLWRSAAGVPGASVHVYDRLTDRVLAIYRTEEQRHRRERAARLAECHRLAKADCHRLEKECAP